MISDGFPLTASDAYKFSMSIAGVPFRSETYYYAHRKGGPHYMPVDPEAFIKSLMPKVSSEDLKYLSVHGFNVDGFKEAYYGNLQVSGVRKGEYFYDREPAFLVKGASALASWPEPLAIQLHYRIQAAGAIRASADSDRIDPRLLRVTCEEEKEIILELCQDLKLDLKAYEVSVLSDAYMESVYLRAKELVQVVEYPDRILEVGFRAASCLQQHELALTAIKSAGILKTSNVFLARKLGMTPVGTMGHEHIQRYGDDYESYIAMRDRRPGNVFYLPDTFSTLRSGIPSALQAILETPKRHDGIRFDSEEGIEGHYAFTVARARELGIEPPLVFESGWNHDLTVRFEQLRNVYKWPANKQLYGIGGFLVKPTWPSFLRDDVSAVYKLSQSGTQAVMKFGDESGGGKSSLPGNPVIMTRQGARYIIQEGENWSPKDLTTRTLSYSPETQRLIKECQSRRLEAILRAAQRSL